jgi:hypothetical protein
MRDLGTSNRYITHRIANMDALKLTEGAESGSSTYDRRANKGLESSYAYWSVVIERVITRTIWDRDPTAAFPR